MSEVPEEESEEEQQRGGVLRVLLRVLGVVLIVQLIAVGISAAIALYVKRTRPSVGDEDSDEVDLVTIFDGLELTSRARSFRGGSWIAMFGGGELDLREATLDPSGATLRVQALMGGGDIQIPDGWNVELASKAIMGGAAVHRPNATDDPYAPTLRIEARMIMGGFGITSGD